MAHSRRFKKDRRALPLSTPLLQAIDGVMSLTLCPLLCSNTHLSLLMDAMPVSVSAGLTKVKSKTTTLSALNFLTKMFKILTFKTSVMWSVKESKDF